MAKKKKSSGSLNKPRRIKKGEAGYGKKKFVVKRSEEHKKDRELYRESILFITQRLDKVEDDVSYIKGKLDGKEEKE